MSTTDMQVAINDRNRREHKFFTARVGKSSSSGIFQQGIPQRFARHHPELSGKNVTLENASAAKWQVLVLQTHAQKVLRFSKGWRAFATGNKLRVGDLLILTQIGDLHFKVTVYDCHGNSVVQPPNPAPNADEALTPTATACDCCGKALADPALVKTEPFSPTAMPLQPLTVAVKPEYPLTQPPVGDSNLAKVILRHILPPPPSGQFPDPHITAALTEVPVPIQASTVDRRRVVAPKEEQNEMEVAEGNDYIDGSMMNRRNYERGAQKKISSAKSIPSLMTGSKHHEVGESSKRQKVQAQGEDTEAVRLLRQQGRKKFSDIVCKHRQHGFVSATDKKGALDAAMEFSSHGKHRFAILMCAAQVYHNFYLPVLAEMQVATGTRGAKKVEAWLTDRDGKLYMVNWEWSEFWKSLMLKNDEWARFALDHFLEEGDVCVFELVNSISASSSWILFHVHIFRVEEAHRDSYTTPLTNTFPPGHQ